MASANVELVRSIYAGWERGNYHSVEWAHPDIELTIADGPTPGRWAGPTGLAEGWSAFLGAWDGFRSEADEYRELDGERVLVLTRFGGRGKASGLDVGQMRAEGAGLAHVRDGKVTRLILYFDREHALADLGLKA
jgi:ketosteroid isomerase-like protein